MDILIRDLTKVSYNFTQKNIIITEDISDYNIASRFINNYQIISNFCVNNSIKNINSNYSKVEFSYYITEN